MNARDTAEQMLAHFDRAKQEVQTATTLAAAKAFADKARAVKAYAKLAKDRTLVERATELRMHAERRMGELLAAMEAAGEKATGKGGDRKSRSITSTVIPTLKTLGVSKDEAARAKRLAEPTPEVFEQAIADAKKIGELTDKVVIRHATKRAAKTKAARGAWPFRGAWTPAEIVEADTWFATMPKGEALKTRLAEGGCTAKAVLRAARYCAGASEAYRREAVAHALRRSGDGGAAMLYGDPPPGDRVALWIARLLTELTHEFRTSGDEPEVKRLRAIIRSTIKQPDDLDAFRTLRLTFLRAACDEADRLSELIQERGDREWKQLYAATTEASPSDADVAGGPPADSHAR